jgi:hypothetical protein
MANENFETPNGLGPIRDPQAQRVCTLVGIEAAHDRLVSFQQLREALDLSIRDLERQRRKEKTVNRALLVARLTKATCDAFLGMAAGFAKVVLPEPAAKAAATVEAAYGTATPWAEAVSTAASGGKADWVKAGTSSAKKAVSLVTEDKGYKILVKSTATKIEVLKSALNGDTKVATKSAVSYIYDLHVSIGEMAGVKKVALFATIAKQAFEYNEQVGKAADELLDGDLSTDQRYIDQKATILKQAKLISGKIAELEDYIQSCEPEAPQILP